jgi:hypothetical protein
MSAPTKDNNRPQEEENEMLIHPYHQEIDQRRRREERQAIRRQRLAAHRGAPRGVRRAVGHSMIRIGSRLASDPARQGARSI